MCGQLLPHLPPGHSLEESLTAKSLGQEIVGRYKDQPSHQFLKTAYLVTKGKPLKVESFIDSLRQSLPGQPIRYFRYAANSLMVYVACTPDDLVGEIGDPGFIVWLEPTWHVCSRTTVLVGSRDAQEDWDGNEPDWDELLELLNPLVGKCIDTVTIDSRTNDLLLTLEDGNLLRTFVSEARSDHIWHIDDHSRRIALYAGVMEFELVDREDNSEVISELRRMFDSGTS